MDSTLGLASKTDIPRIFGLFAEAERAAYRTMVLVAQCLGLRVSEILGLQRGDFNFEGRTVLVQRSVVGGRVDDVKTEYSKDEVPLDPRLADVLLRWRSETSSRVTRTGSLPIPPLGSRTTKKAFKIGRSRKLPNLPG